MNPEPFPDDRAFAAEIYRRLLVAYGEPTWRPYYQPMDELVLTFLSQNTSDLNSGRAFEALKARYPTWQGVLDAPVAELAETIRSGGLSQQKAPRIQKALRRILAERGEFNLDFLADSAGGRSHALADLLRRHRAQDRVDRAALLFQQAGVPGGHATWAASRDGWGWPDRRTARRRSRRSGKAWRRRRGSTRCI